MNEPGDEAPSRQGLLIAGGLMLAFTIFAYRWLGGPRPTWPWG